jgi:drug/metabolite transporter (DMT)-like permease/GNAT superfamily N-acetyltransferase
MTEKRYETKHVLAAIATVLVWSSAFTAVSMIVAPGGGYGPGQLVLFRFLVASATMAIVAVARRQRLPRREDVGHIMLAALFGITTYQLAFTFGETGVSAGASALIIASGPIWTALLAVAFLGERLNKYGWAGVALAFAGVSAISFGEGTGGFAFQPMAAVTLVAALATATYFVLSKKPLRSYSALEFTSYVIWFGTVPMLVFLPGLVQQLPAAPAWATATIVYLGVFPGALAYALWSYALSGMPASTTASFLYAQPVLASLVAWVVQKAVPSTVTMIGGTLALAGVVIVQTKGRPKEVIATVVATTPAQRAQVRELIDELLDWFVAEQGFERERYDAELAAFDDLYGGERGRTFLATVDGVPAGCVVFRELGPGVAEMRRMYVRPAYRRRGIARKLIALAESEARDLGYHRVQFVTSPRFEGAVDLYIAEGFEPMPLYRSAPDPIVAFGRDL